MRQNKQIDLNLECSDEKFTAYCKAGLNKQMSYRRAVNHEVVGKLLNIIVNNKKETQGHASFAL